MSDIKPTRRPDAGPSRRTVMKGAAWAVPVITIATAAPAFAVSGFLTVSGAGCKLPGNSQGSFKGYVFRMSAQNTTPNTQVITITSATLNGDDLGAVTIINLSDCTTLGNPITLAAGASLSNLALLTVNASNSQNGTLVVTYTVQGGGGGTSTASVPSVDPIQGSCTVFSPSEVTCINSI